MTLRAAIGFSAAFHVVLLTAAPSSGWLAPRQKHFEVSYVPARAVVSPAPAAAARPQPAPVPQSRISDPVPGAPVAPARISTPAPAAAPAPRPMSRPVTRNDVAAPAPRPAISSLPDKEFVFLDHKEQVRKHLKARLHYPSFLGDGSVRLRVVLGPDGSFKQAVVLETSDARLAGLAVKDAQAAAPYPPLPAKIHPRQVRYEFLVRYRPE